MPPGTSCNASACRWEHTAQPVVLVGRLHQLGPQPARNHDGVTCVARDARPRRGVLGVVRVDQHPDRRSSPRLVDIEDDDAIGVAIHSLRADPERASSAHVEARVEHDTAGQAAELAVDVISAMPEDDDDLIDARVHQLLHLVGCQRLAFPFEQRFGPAHSTRSPGGKDDTGDH